MKKQEATKMKSDWFEEELNLKTFFIITGGIILIWGIFWIGILFGIEKSEDRGTFGDMFGSINSLFSGLALAGIIYTMLLQKQELRLQRLELKANREELSRTATAQENQADSQKISARLNALSTLINYHLDNINRQPNWPHGNDQAKIMLYKNEIEEILEKKS